MQKDGHFVKTLGLLLLSVIVYAGLFRSWQATGFYGATDWLLNPVNSLMLAVPLTLLRWQRQVSRWAERVIWQQRASLAGEVSVLPGTSDDGPLLQRKTRGRSRTWTILAVWAAALLVIVAYMRSGAAFEPTLALAAIGGLYWVAGSWRLYGYLSSAAVWICAGSALLGANVDGAALMGYAAFILMCARTRRSLWAAMSAVVVFEGTRHGLMGEAALGVGLAWTFSRTLGQISSRIFERLEPGALLGGAAEARRVN